jgi:hypothetical protein
MAQETSAVLEDLLTRIKQLPGPKIVTLAHTTDTFEIDIDPQGVCGYDPSHERLFRTKLARALHEGGGLMIRQFLPLKVQRRMPNGKLMWVPEKKLYGLFLGQGVIHALSAEEVRKAACTDATSGAPLEPEEGVTYATWGAE